MASKLDDIFNECYERIRSGESLESCLRSYPQYRHELEPLLRTTFDIGRRVSYIHPRPEFKHWARVRLESAQRYPRQQAQAPAETRAMPGWLRHGWALAVVAGLLLLLGTGSTMAASSDSLPTEPLYPVKLFTEDVQRAIAVSPERKAQLETDIANIRAVELEAMANAGNTEQAIKAAERYDSQFERAVQAIVVAGGTQTYTPPVATTPPATTPPVTTTPLTTPPETKPPVTTQTASPPADNTTSVTTTPVSTPADNTTSLTNPSPTVPPASANTTSAGTTTPPTTNQNPPSTNNQEPAATTQEPSTNTTSSNEQESKIYDLKKSLDRTTSRTLAALKQAHDDASDNSKSDWQSAYNKVRDRQDKWRNNNDSSSDNITIQEENSTAPDTSNSKQDNSSNRDRRSNHR
jgi:hypothetical protein